MRFRLVRPRFLVFLAVATASLAAPAVGSAAERLVAVDEANRLVVFSSDTPRAITRVRVTGLGAGERLLGLDVRPANGQLVAVTSSSRLHALDAGTGAATAIGQAPFSPSVSGGAFGFDFNPTVDRIRLTSDGRQNLRLHPDTGAVAAVDGMLAYGTSDAGNGAGQTRRSSLRPSPITGRPAVTPLRPSASRSRICASSSTSVGSAGPPSSPRLRRALIVLSGSTITK